MIKYEIFSFWQALWWILGMCKEAYDKAWKEIKF